MKTNGNRNAYHAVDGSLKCRPEHEFLPLYVLAVTPEIKKPKLITYQYSRSTKTEKY